MRTHLRYVTRDVLGLARPVWGWTTGGGTNLGWGRAPELE
jgi:hypothetical protein